MTPEEQKTEVTEGNNPYTVEDDTPSTASQDVSDGQVADEDEEITIKKVDFEKRIQSEADKRTATARLNALKEAKTAKAEADRIKREAEDKLDEERWRGREDAMAEKWLSDGAPEAAVTAWRADRANLRAAMRSQKQKEAEYAPKFEKVDRYEAADEAIASVIGADGLDRLTPAQYKAIVTAADGDSIKERIAYAKVKAIEMKTEVKASTNTNTETTGNKARRPAPTGSGNAPTGSRRSFTRDQIAKMSPEEYAKNEDIIFEALKSGRIK